MNFLNLIFSLFFNWLDLAISRFSSIFYDFVEAFGHLGFLHFKGLSWLSVFISLNLFSVSIKEILEICFLDSLFQDLFFAFF